MFSFLRANGSLSKSSILHVPLSCMSKIGLSFNNNCISAFPFSKSLCPLILSYSTSELLSITFSSLFRIISGKHRRKQQKDPKSNHRKCQQACSGIIYGRHVPGLARILGRRTRKKHPKDYSFRCFLSFPVYIHVPSKLHTKNHHPSPSQVTYSRFGYALDRLVTVSSMRYRTSTSALSTSSSSRGLTNLSLWDISS